MEIKQFEVLRLAQCLQTGRSVELQHISSAPNPWLCVTATEAVVLSHLVPKPGEAAADAPVPAQTLHRSGGRAPQWPGWEAGEHWGGELEPDCGGRHGRP